MDGSDRRFCVLLVHGSRRSPPLVALTMALYPFSAGMERVEVSRTPGGRWSLHQAGRRGEVIGELHEACAA